MANDPSHDLDRLLAEAAASADAGPCPAENVLAALAEGRLDEREVSRALDHVVACGGCRDLVRALSPQVESARPAGRRLTFPRALAAAAAVLLAVGAGFLFVRRGTGGASDDSGDSVKSLEVAAARLSREAPSEFGEFRPLGAAELRARGGAVLRGAEIEASPSGRLVDPRPTFRWHAVAGARTYRVTLLGPEGVMWEETTSSTTLAWPASAPPLAPGSRAAWTVTADDPHATETRRAIEVVDDAEAARWRRAVEVASSVEMPLRWLLLAHAALRRDLWSEALAYAERFLEARPGDPLGEATLAAAADRLSSR